jgi:hypothetical protein
MLTSFDFILKCNNCWNLWRRLIMLHWQLLTPTYCHRTLALTLLAYFSMETRVAHFIFGCFGIYCRWHKSMVYFEKSVPQFNLFLLSCPIILWQSRFIFFTAYDPSGFCSGIEEKNVMFCLANRMALANKNFNYVSFCQLFLFDFVDLIGVCKPDLWAWNYYRRYRRKRCSSCRASVQ